MSFSVASMSRRRFRPQLEELGNRCVPAQTAIQVADIYVGSSTIGPSSSPTNLTNVNGTLYFTASDTGIGVELWKSDGTDAGTVRVKDIRKGTLASNPQELTAVGDLVYFITDGGTGRRLWRSDGTEAGTAIVPDSAGRTTSFFDFSELTSFNGDLFFKANLTTPTGPTGLELWRVATSDGMIHPGPVSLPGRTAVNPTELTVVPTAEGTGSYLYFAGNTPSVGRELWRSDGTDEGTIVADIRPGGGDPGRPLSSNPEKLTASGTSLYFVASDSTRGVELWRTNEESGAQIVADIRPGLYGSSPANLTDVDGTLFFVANDGASGAELWRTDLTGAVLVKDIRPRIYGSSPTSLVNVDGILYFAANDGGKGTELWRSDGTTEGTTIVRNIRRDAASSSPSRLTEVNGQLYFSANDGISGEEVWISDGTFEGTRVLFNIGRAASTGSSPTSLTNVDGTLYFAAYERRAGIELWRSREALAIVEPDSQSNNERDSVSLAIEVANLEGNPLRFSAFNLPPGLTINSTTGVISGTIGGQAARIQPYEVTVTATDVFESVEATFLWSVVDNTVPIITNPGPQGNNEGNRILQPTFDAYDPEGDPLTYRAVGLPDGLHVISIPNPNGYFFGNIGPQAAVNGNYGDPRDGVYQVTVYASDGLNEGSTTFLWTIGDVTAPVLDIPGPQFNNEGNHIGLYVIAHDSGGDALTYSATGLPPYLYIVPKSDNTAQIIGVLTSESAGTYDVTVSANDGHNTSSATFTWTIRDVSLPTIQNPGTLSNPPGGVVSLQIVADDVDNDPLTYQAFYLPPGLSIDYWTGLITGAIAPDAEGSYHVTVRVSDGADPVQTSFTWNVASGGRLDPEFSSDGFTTTNFRNEIDRAYGTAVQANGKIVVVGMAQTAIDGIQSDFALARYNTDGTLDATFGPGGLDGDGRVTTDRSIADEARAVAMQGELILVAGSTQQSGTDFALLRYKSLGGLDTEFASDESGIEIVDFGANDSAFAMALQPDGKIVVGGITSGAGWSDFALVRFSVDGLVDSTFGDGGQVITDIAGGIDTLSGLTVQSDGKIVAVGTARIAGVDQFVAVRYLTNGTLDDTFGAISGSVRTGKALIPIGQSASASGVALRGDGAILLAGASYETSTGFNFTLAMLEADGDLDGTFGVGGVVRTDLPGINEQARAVTFQSDGKIVLAGRSGSGATADFALVRYNSTGALDTSFDLDGILISNLGGEDELFGIALDGNRLVAVGSSNPGSVDFAVARYLL